LQYREEVREKVGRMLGRGGEKGHSKEGERTDSDQSTPRTTDADKTTAVKVIKKKTR